MLTDELSSDSIEKLLLRAKSGGGYALGDLFMHYTNYLTLLARLQIGRHLQGKLDPSDVVQETFLKAHRYFEGFLGSSEGEFIAWLRRILVSVLADTIQHYLGARIRDPRLERQIGEAIDRSSCGMSIQLVDRGTSPSEVVMRRERAVLLADAIAQLPEDYRETVLLRFAEGLPFAEIANRMGRSVDSVEKLWLRGIVRLREIMVRE